jgi:hypothetical protein
MKKVFVLIMVLLFPMPLIAQEGEIMILSKRVGEEIDVQERNYYKLWGDIKGFQSAVFLQTEEGCMLKITYIEDEQEKILSLGISVDRFRWFGEYIDHFEEIEAGTYELKGYEVHRQPVIEPSIEPAKAGLWTYALESFGAAVGAGIGVMGGLLIGGGINGDGSSPAGQAIGILLGTAVGAPVSSALGVTIAGESLEQKGSINGALVGSVLVMGCLGCNPLAMLYVAPLTMPLGAVIGYNYKALSKGDHSAIGKILVGSLVGSAAGFGAYLLLFSVLQ